jgi:hypothetical protein
MQRLNTKDVFLFLLSQNFGISSPRQIFGTAQRYGFFTNTKYETIVQDISWREHAKALKKKVEEETGKELTLEEMLKIVPGKRKELVQCFYLANGDPKGALEIYNAGRTSPNQAYLPPLGRGLDKWRSSYRGKS